MADWYVGTMGFSYKDWEGVFYPVELNPRNYLGYYSRIFNGVEIDSTFYGIPKPGALHRWADATPPDFRFSLKAPRQITHEAGLIGVRNLLLEFIEAVRLLEERLGAVLLQFPPSFKVDRLPDLEAFLAILPGGVRFAVEVRSASWYTPAAQGAEPPLAQLLRRYGVCWAATEYPGLPELIHPTADFLYLRWIGKHGSYRRHDYERQDRSEKLRQWWQMIQHHTAHVDDVYGFFNNDYVGFAAGTANRFKAIAGLPWKPLASAQQAKLF